MTVFSAETKKLTRNSAIRITAAALFFVCVISALFAVRAEKKNNYTKDEINALYASQTAQFIRNAERSLSQLEKLGVGDRAYSREYYGRIIDVYTKARESIRVKHDGTDGWDGVLGSEPVLILSLIGAAVAGALSVLEDKRTGAYLLVRATKNGRRMTSVSKAVNVMLLSFAGSVCLSLLYLVVFALSGRLGDGAAELQTAKSFMYSPLGLKLWEAFLLLTVRRAALGAACGGMFFVLASYLPSYTAVFGAGAAFFAVQFVLFTANFRAVDVFCQNVNVFAYGGPYLLRRHYSVRFFGAADAFAVSASFLLTALAAVVIFAIFSNVRGVVLKRRRIKEAREKTRKKAASPRSLFAWELRKRLTPPVLAAMIAGLAVRAFISFYTLGVDDTVRERIYRDYCGVYSEMTVSEAGDAIAAEDERIQSGIQLKNLAIQKKRDGLITELQYDEMMYEYGYCYARVGVSMRCLDRIRYLRTQDSENVRFTYDTAAEKLLGTDADAVLVILIIICLSPLFSSEYEYGTYQVIRCCRNGRRRTVAAKLAAALTVTTVMFVCFSALDLSVAYANGAFEGARYSVMSIAAGSGAFADVSLGAYTAILLLLRYSAYVAFASAVSAFSELSGGTVPAISLSTCVVFIPYVVRILTKEPFPFDISAAMAGNPLLLGNGTVPYITLVAAAAVCAVACERESRCRAVG